MVSPKALAEVLIAKTGERFRQDYSKYIDQYRLSRGFAWVTPLLVPTNFMQYFNESDFQVIHCCA